MTVVVYAFGYNEDGQCGEATTQRTKIHYPQPLRFDLILPPRVKIACVSAGSRHTLALTDSGTVYSWGWGSVGQLGLGNFQSISTPTRIPALENIKQISAGGMHSACVDNVNRCYTWGSNTYGQLGLGYDAYEESDSHSVPSLVRLKRDAAEVNTDTGFLEVRMVACGGMHTAAIAQDGSLYCWGKSDNGQTGFPKWYTCESPCLYYPRKVSSLPEEATGVACGGFYTLVLTKKGPFAMGKEDFGCLGMDPDELSTGVENPLPILPLANQKIQSLDAGGWHSCFLSSEGHVHVVGKGEYGRLGVGGESSKLVPVLLTRTQDKDQIGRIKEISAGGSHSLWYDENNEVFAVGRLDGGRCGFGPVNSDRCHLGVNITAHFCQPADMSHRVVQVSAGGSHSIVVLDFPDVAEDDASNFMAKLASTAAERLSASR